MTNQFDFRAEIDGSEATVEALSSLAFAGFAHFTAMQVRDGAVKGLDLHLARLHRASVEFFGQALSDDLVRERIRNALQGAPSAVSVTATMYSRSGEFTPTGADNDPAVLVRTAPSFDGPEGPLRLTVVQHERPFPTIKHVGEASKTQYLRRAVENGFDDAVFVDSHGHVSEATIWNVVFWDGEAVIWPKAALLPGVTMGIIRRQLAILGITQREEQITLARLADMKGAALMNSWTPGVAVSGFDAVSVPSSATLIEILKEAYAREPLVAI
ncbi:MULTISPECIES: aminotransferase class IV family protein [Rhizobium/Agrobacterium group]|uniref:Probable branched-chain-amino-acid aminotransferase n=1 Tax=Rhizobium rhizogenes TaxID=359 RepID=A0A546X108_RHIRH|nr:MULTISPECIES: aminotransferase class IV family protein [Rhizobium/Agrobacterium group]TRA94445.1 aminotransferase class IV [Rhizobium rhizogenes]